MDSGQMGRWEPIGRNLLTRPAPPEASGGCGPPSLGEEGTAKDYAEPDRQKLVGLS